MEINHYPISPQNLLHGSDEVQINKYYGVEMRQKNIVTTKQRVEIFK